MVKQAVAKIGMAAAMLNNLSWKALEKFQARRLNNEQSKRLKSVQPKRLVKKDSLKKALVKVEAWAALVKEGSW